MDTVLSSQLLVAALVLAAIYALTSLGLNLIYGTMRLLNVAHGEIMMVGGYVSYWCFVRWGISPLISIVFVVLLAGMLGALCYLSIFKAVVRNREIAARLESNSLLIFFGLSIIVQNLLSLIFKADQRSYPYLDAVVPIGDARVELNRLVVLAIGAGTTIACVLFFRLSRIGLAIRALIQQRDAASLIGIDAEKMNLLVFSLGFAVAGMAGSLVGMTSAISPFSGFPYTISAFIVIILGGLGNLAGGLLGAVVLAFVEIYGVAITSSAYRSILVYGVFILILLLRPQGLLGRKAA
ncbi:branched-chain amino acid ABC transporter permease [Bradyrhizobium cenepequi]